MSAPELSELDHLREIERLAHRVVAESSGTEFPEPFRRELDALSRTLRSHHFEGDGCTEEDRPRIRLVGACLLRPGLVPAGTDESYEEMCARLAVEPRPEGWALWHTWADGSELRVTMVVTAVGTTEGLFENWARGRSFDPVTPLPSQVVRVLQGWIGPVTFSPRGVGHTGLGGRPVQDRPV
ncbi:hypothetical protein OHA37_26040 [Streptomyces sp. NBC_00335]|uniref:hypothetical protein n=1 Tax=unclassified Streptomyces TaxID=2593676 RepID=UPI00225A275D|nr:MULTISPECIES: hypothetical protein [unclassified Streptomyces]MCX5407313.1 hypothetical protein [Streptomyces sp. NBC_00086]